MIQKYKKKPVEVEAVIFDGTNIDEIKVFCGDKLLSYGPDKTPEYRLFTQNGLSYRVSLHDYVVKTSSNDFRLYSQNDFDKAYDLL